MIKKVLETTYMNTPRRQWQSHPTITPKNPKRQRPDGDFLVKEQTRSQTKDSLLCFDGNGTIACFR
jgi:hypothetical protein